MKIEEFDDNEPNQFWEKGNIGTLYQGYFTFSSSDKFLTANGNKLEMQGTYLSK